MRRATSGNDKPSIWRRSSVNSLKAFSRRAGLREQTLIEDPRGLIQLDGQFTFQRISRRAVVVADDPADELLLGRTQKLAEVPMRLQERIHSRFAFSLTATATLN